MQGAKPYQGKHVAKPLYKSEYVSNDLNPTWKALVLDLNRRGLNSVDEELSIIKRIANLCKLEDQYVF